MKVRQIRRWLTDKSPVNDGRRRNSLANEDDLAQQVVEQHNKDLNVTEKDKGDIPTEALQESLSKIEATTPSSKKLEEALLDLEKNPSTDPTVATRDDSPSIARSHDSPQKSELWETTQVTNNSWEKNKGSYPDPTLDLSPSSSFEESIVEGMENLGDFFSLEPDVDDTLSVSTEGMKPSKMHNANIFGNRMMTARTLESICNDDRHIQRAYSTPDYLTTDDEATTSSASHDSPSIPPGVLDSKMTRLLLDPYNANEAVQHQRCFNRGQQPIPRRKKVDPKDLAFLKPKQLSPSSSAKGMAHEKRSSVSLGIEKFGGKKKSLVELRKEQLQKSWAADKKVVRVKKIEWGECHKTGQYKRKITVQAEKG